MNIVRYPSDLIEISNGNDSNLDDELSLNIKKGIKNNNDKKRTFIIVYLFFLALNHVPHNL